MYRVSCWHSILDTRYTIHDTRYTILDTRYSILEKSAQPEQSDYSYEFHAFNKSSSGLHVNYRTQGVQAAKLTTTRKRAATEYVNNANSMRRNYASKNKKSKTKPKTKNKTKCIKEVALHIENINTWQSWSFTQSAAERHVVSEVVAATSSGELYTKAETVDY